MSQYVEPAQPKACTHCPWRLSNQCKAGTEKDPHAFYSKANLKRLWSKLRNGESMTCHPTDPRVAEDFEHAPSVKDSAATHECTGALILQQREFQKFQEAVLDGRADGDYPHRVPRMTKRGLIEIVNRAMLGKTPFAREMSTPNLNDPDVGYAPLGEWSPRSEGGGS